MEGLKKPAGRPNPGGAFEKWTVRLLLPALGIALAVFLAGIIWPRPNTPVDWRAWFDGPERGLWRAETLDGRDVFAGRFTVAIAEGEVDANMSLAELVRVSRRRIAQAAGVDEASVDININWDNG